MHSLPYQHASPQVTVLGILVRLDLPSACMHVIIIDPKHFSIFKQTFRCYQITRRKLYHYAFSRYMGLRTEWQTCIVDKLLKLMYVLLCAYYLQALADPATLGAMVMSSDVYLDRYKFPPLVQPVPEGENNYFRKRTSQSNSNGIIAGHTQDNVSHRKAFNLKLFHLPLISIDLDSKVYKDESLVADIGKRNGW